MLSAQLITIGTEIVSGEVVNTNAAWLSQRLEELGIRVFTHLSVRDQKEEMLQALNFNPQSLVFVTGGLGPTSDDITREILAIHLQQPLDFDNQVWADLKAMYVERGLPLREAHRWQCHFPRGATKLKNPTGTALGFYKEFEGRHYFVLPGPPRELEGMWREEVKSRVESLRTPTTMDWVRWTCLGAPESEVAEKVEPVIAGRDIEVGYRAQIPYVRVKVYVDPVKQKDIVDAMEAALKPWIVARGFEDLAGELVKAWPDGELRLLDRVTGTAVAQRLIAYKPDLLFTNQGELDNGIEISADGEELVVRVKTKRGEKIDRRTLPYKVSLNSERGRRSATEWAVWSALEALRALSSQP